MVPSTSISWSGSITCHVPARPQSAAASTGTAAERGANQAVAAARFGAAVRFIGAMAEDHLGDEAVAEPRALSGCA